LLLPHLRNVSVSELIRDGQALTIRAHSKSQAVRCPGCGVESSRVHGRYVRRLRDAPVAGARMIIELQVRRFTCRQPGCGRVTFVEQVDGLSAAHSRFSPPLRVALQAIAVALAGRPGARLAGALGIAVGRDTLLGLLQALPDPPAATVTVLGVDDFALRRGHHYATVLLDMVTGRPVEVIGGRDGEPLAEWLRAHPGVEVICRDRAGAYAEGARAGAPDATQVADRWHLWHGLGEAVDRTVAAHHACVRAALTAVAATTAQPPPPTNVAGVDVEVDRTGDVFGRPRRLVARTRQRHADVQARLAAGASLAAICRELDLDLGTVRRFARAATVDELLVKAVNRVSVLDGYTAHLAAGYATGTTNAVALHQQIQALGYTGGVQPVRRWLRPLRQADPTAPPATATRPEIPKPRHIVRWIMTDEGRLTTEQRASLDQVLAACPHLTAAAGHVRDFAKIMATRTGHQLDAWMTAVAASDLPALHSLLVGLRRDHAAVTAGLTMTWSSGRVEGNVNRIKTIKRQMYGRAGLALLRKRILHR
jgi:transposase